MTFGRAGGRAVRIDADHLEVRVEGIVAFGLHAHREAAHDARGGLCQAFAAGELFWIDPMHDAVAATRDHAAVVYDRLVRKHVVGPLGLFGIAGAVGIDAGFEDLREFLGTKFNDVVRHDFSGSGRVSRATASIGGVADARREPWARRAVSRRFLQDSVGAVPCPEIPDKRRAGRFLFARVAL